MGEKISLPVREADGALTGFRSVPAPSDGYYVEEGEVSIFLPIELVLSAARRIRVRRR